MVGLTRKRKKFFGLRKISENPVQSLPQRINRRRSSSSLDRWVAD